MSRRPKLGTVTVGQTVIVRSQRGRVTGWIRSTVVKVGRIWIDVEPQDGESYLSRYEVRFRMDTQNAAQNAYARFVTEAQYIWDLESEAAREVLRNAQIDTTPGYMDHPWNSGDRLLALAAFVAGYDADHPTEDGS